MKDKILKKIKTLNNDEIIKILITSLFIFLPIIDMLRATPVKDIELFGIAIIELLNLLLISISFILTIPKIKKKHLKYLSIYFLAIIIYGIFHVINTYSFNTILVPESTHNFIVESYYIIRVYILPLLLMIILFENKKKFNRKYYLNIMKYLVIMISGQIVILNLCRFSYSSYAEGASSYLINKTNFIDVFNYTDDYKNLLTVGLFESTNQISIILFMLLSINIYNLYLQPKIKNLLLVVLQCVSMIIIGTKVAALGSILVLVATIIMYYFFVILKREKLELKYSLMHITSIIIVSIIFFISPFTRLYTEEIPGTGFKNDLPKEEIQTIRNKIDEDLSNEEITKILIENPKVFKISPMFYQMYPVENDTEFWLTIAKRDRKINNNYRTIKNDIMRRIMEQNDNKLDKLLGMGYTIRTMDMEKDYVYQYYLFGIIGLILLIGVYIFFYIYNILKIFKKSYFNYTFCINLIPPFLGLVACYFSGHLFGWVSPMIILATTLCIERVNE